jgi:hypothetical protein
MGNLAEWVVASCALLGMLGGLLKLFTDNNKALAGVAQAVNGITEIVKEHKEKLDDHGERIVRVETQLDAHISNT